jgi:hypothetical protein
MLDLSDPRRRAGEKYQRPPRSAAIQERPLRPASPRAEATLDRLAEEKVAFEGGPENFTYSAPLACGFRPDNALVAAAHKGGYLTVWTVQS